MDSTSKLFHPETIASMPYLYALCKDKTTITAAGGRKHPPIQIAKMQHNSKYEYGPASRDFNRGIRQERTILVTGDNPRAALLTTHPETRVDPHFMKLGDLRISVEYGKLNRFLDDADEIRVYFKPASTEWLAHFDEIPDTCFKLCVSLASEDSIAGFLEVTVNSTLSHPLIVQMSYGGFQAGDRTYYAPYFKEGEYKVPSFVSLFSSEQAVPIVYKISPGKTPEIEGKYLSPLDETVLLGFYSDINNIHHFISEDKAVMEVDIGSSTRAGFSVFHAKEDETLAASLFPADISELMSTINHDEERLQALLHSCKNETPSTVLDAAFRHAVLNHDYIHVGKAWLEGVHWWNCYWTNNYQISAAISLGQFERAREALLFFGSIKGGYTTINAAGERAWKEHYPELDRDILGYDGVPYYIYQLWQYCQATGDYKTAEAVFDNLLQMVRDMMLVRDPDGNGLLGWHMGCNSFMYQGDHLGLPGDGASPSLMMAGMFEHLSVIAAKIDRTEESRMLSDYSRRIYDNLPALWDSDAGYFFSHKDTQGYLHRAHYYTDLVFPVLYSELSEEEQWQSLAHLKNSLLFKSRDTGLTLMRVADLKPDIFGNNNVMPVQMAESARAFECVGDTQTASALMEGVALAALLYTEAPGSFPERMNNEGKGEPNYLFGNPCASYAYSYIDGIFGLSLTDDGTVLRFSPSFPREWTKASLSLPYAEISFKSENDTFSYLIRIPKDSTVRNISISPLFAPLEAAKATVNGSTVSCLLTAALHSTRVCCTIPAHETNHITVSCQFAPKFEFPVIKAAEQSVPEFIIPEQFRVSDPQGILTGAATPGLHTLYLHSEIYHTVIELQTHIFKAACIERITAELNSQSNLYFTVQGCAFAYCNREISITLSLYTPKNRIMLSKASIKPDDNGYFTVRFPFPSDITDPPHALLIKANLQADTVLFEDYFDVVIPGNESNRKAPPYHLPLKELLTDKHLFVCSAWRNISDYSVTFDTMDSNGKLETPAGEFLLIPQQENSNSVMMKNITAGISENDSRKIKTGNTCPCLTVPVGLAAGSISLFYVTEIESRLTGDTVGAITLQYKSGVQRELPLVVGKQVSSIFGHFAQDVIRVPVDDFYKTDSASIFTIGLDPDKVLNSFTINLSMADVQFGLLAVNVNDSKGNA